MQQVKRALLSLAVIISFIGYSFGLRHPDSGAGQTVTVIPRNTANGSSSGNTTQPASSGTSSSSSNSSAKTYKDGTYTGNAADAFYGYIQVKVVISGGKLTDVQFLQYPNDRQTSIEINQQAMPYLKQEALQAQSAQVDGVTGATDTSQAFIESLSSALSKAG